jgi:2-dehydro-3-deoxy-D-arabinonate dehydratase
MRLLQFSDPSDGQHVGVVEGDQVVDLTQGGLKPRSVFELYYDMGGDSEGLAKAAGKALEASRRARRIPLGELLAGRGPASLHLVKSVSGPPETPRALRVWLAGVTHEVSAKLRDIEARKATGGAITVYDQKYRECAAGGRPELFPKTDPDAVVGHGQAVTRPPDTQRLVAETELVSVYGLRRNGQVERIGFTGGNDVTDNAIEADNPLNLPQAKNWAGGCASLGPLLVTADEFDDRVVQVSCEIVRGGRRLAFKEGETGQDRLNMPARLLHMERALFGRLPLRSAELQGLFWGTPIVFSQDDVPDGLQEGDTMRLGFGGGIGVLENPIVAQAACTQLQELNAG